jgi:hypothetical protein
MADDTSKPAAAAGEARHRQEAAQAVDACWRARRRVSQGAVQSPATAHPAYEACASSSCR